MKKTKKRLVKRGRKRLPTGEKKGEVRFFIAEKIIDANGGKEPTQELCKEFLINKP